MQRQYNLLHVIGDGGEARVHFAVCVQSGQYCAVKIPRVHWDPISKELLRREAVRRLQVQGPRVVNVLDWNFDGPTPFIAIEYADYLTLQHEFAELGANNEVYHPQFALSRIREILLALAHIHDRNVIHRVKPENICRFSNGDIALNDFGIGRTLTRPYDLQTRTFVGTEIYAAPEQRLGLPVDHRSDLYAAGVILYQMLMGWIPNDRAERWPRPSWHWYNVYDSVDSLLIRLLAFDPNDRFISASQAALEVSRILAIYEIADRMN